jgi:chemotaxis protein methyltransferase CheR
VTPTYITTLREIVLREAAQAIEDGKEYFVDSRLAPLAKERDLTIPALVEAARRDRALATKVVEALCIHETSWYRDARAFEALRPVLSDLAKEKAAHRSISIWSAACSTGQEPYTLAMLASEHPALTGFRVNITATDISNFALERARAGSYSQLEIGRGLPASALVKWFDRKGASWVAKPELLSKVMFRQLNLGQIPYPPLGAPFDLVLLRNVLIYFPVAEKTRVLNHVATMLAPGGVLMLGASETTVGLTDKLTPSRLPDGMAVFKRAS